MQKNFHVTINNRSGSVEHYFHFILGFLTPLFLLREQLINEHQVGRIYIRSCAILDPILNGLGLPELKILTRQAHESAITSQSFLEQNAPLQLLNINGADSPEYYEDLDFRAFNSLLRKQYEPQIAKERAEIYRKFPLTDRPKIVMINRMQPHPYYYSSQTELRGAGSQRRSIPNFASLTSEILANGHNLLATHLEGMSLWQQMALFELADVIIAQHGASLANLIFAKEGLRVIEIFPEDNPIIASKDHFRNLSKRLGLQYQKISQKTSHSPIEIPQLVAMI